jgi:carboxyl-terminal processing protease
MKLRRLAVLAAALFTAACSDSLVGPPAATDYGSLFDDLWHQFDLHYSYFAVANVNWDSLGKHYRPMAVSAPTDHQFARVLASMLAELKDMHVSLMPTGSASPMRYVSRYDTTATYFDQGMTLGRYVRVANSTGDGEVQYGILADSVGYARIADFVDGGAGDMDDVIHGLPGARTLIIDVRDNPGGNYVLAVNMAKRFADQKRTYGYIRRRNGPKHTDFTDYIEETIEPAGTHFSGRVYVLANRHSFSSAEDFVLAMRAIPGVTIVGDTTGGASGGPIVREMANGWTYELSEWIEYTPERVGFESIGLAPTVVAKNSAADEARGVDDALEQALLMARHP